MARSAKLVLKNPSDYSRGGVVITPWKPVAAKLGVKRDARVRVSHDAEEPTSANVARAVRHDTERARGTVLATQVDRLDPDDPEFDQLVFTLDRAINAGDSDYGHPSAFATVEQTTDEPPDTGTWYETYFTGVKLGNRRMHVWINTSVNKHDNENWYGGAITSVQVGSFEMLDALASDLGQAHLSHREIRCAQVDQIHLVRPPWDADTSVDAQVFSEPWRCISVSHGPVRTTATIVSSDFSYTCKDVDQTERVFTCNVYRAISIYADRDEIHEQVWVKGKPQGGDVVPLWFSLRYFMLMRFRKERVRGESWPTSAIVTFRYPNHDGWFAMTSKTRPHHGFGFATDAHAGPIWNPPLDYLDPETRHFAFTWELGATRCARSVHTFYEKTTPKELSDAVGWTWYDCLFRPLRAEVA